MRIQKLAIAVLALSSLRPPAQIVAEKIEPAPEAGRRFGDAPVYVDGEARAVVRFGELPPALAPVWITLADGREARRYRLAEYIELLGVDLARVTELHVHGGRGRVARVRGADLRAAREKLLFSFTRGTSGKPRMHWTPEIEMSDAIDAIAAIAAYVEKDPPRWNVDDWRLELAGRPIDGFAYVTHELRGGTRVNAGGRLVGVLKKNAFPEGAPLADALASIGVSIAAVRSADVIADDEVVATLDARALARQRLVPVPQSGGRMLLAPAGVRGSALVLAMGDGSPQASRIRASE